MAFKLSGQIGNNIKKLRAAQMTEVCAESRRSYLSDQTGTIQRVLFEKETSADYHQGHTAGYVIVRVPRKSSDISLKRQFFDVEIISSEDNCCTGRIISPDD